MVIQLRTQYLTSKIPFSHQCFQDSLSDNEDDIGGPGDEQMDTPSASVTPDSTLAPSPSVLHNGQSSISGSGCACGSRPLRPHSLDIKRSGEIGLEFTRTSIMTNINSNSRTQKSNSKPIKLNSNKVDREQQTPQDASPPFPLPPPLPIISPSHDEPDFDSKVDSKSYYHYN